MESLRAQLSSKLESLMDSRTELLQLQQQQSMTSLSTPHPQASPSSVDEQLITSVVDDTIDRTAALLKLSDHCSDQLQTKMLTELDLVSALLQRNYPSASDPQLKTTSITSFSTRTGCDLIVAVMIAFSVIFVVWFKDICSAMLAFVFPYHNDQ